MGSSIFSLIGGAEAVVRASMTRISRSSSLKNCFGPLSFEEFVEEYLGQGQLAGDSEVIDPSIVPVTQRIVRPGRRDYTNFPTQIDWSQRAK